MVFLVRWKYHNPKYISTLYSPYSDGLVFPLYNIPSPGVLLGLVLKMIFVLVCKEKRLLVPLKKVRRLLYVVYLFIML